jgi:RNA polymerase sigma factor (sigma-70 family)
MPAQSEGGERARGRIDDQDGDAPIAEFARTRADLAEFRAGDASAFERIWLRYRGAVEVMLAGRIRRALEPGLRARLDAELDDVLQEAAMIVLAKLPQFEYRGPGSILAWMAQIGSHVVGDRVDYWRAGRRRPVRERPLAGAITSAAGSSPLADLLRDPAPGPSTQHEQQQARRTVALALAELPDRDHTIVLWRFFAGATWNEIAAELDAGSGESVRKEWTERILPAFAVELARVRVRSG